MIIQATYDPLGHRLTHTDENSHTTSYRYNAYGSPVEITYPDNSQEHFRYTTTGHLKRHTNQDGLTIEYVHDALGRVLSKTYSKGSENPIAQETYVYNAFKLLHETDLEGNCKTYSYDRAGRLVEESFCGKIKTYKYDSLGRIASTFEHNGENTLGTLFQRDLLNRVIEEAQTNLGGKILHKIAYAYDKKGNCCRTTRFINNQASSEERRYDSVGRLVEQSDALRNITKTIYQEDVVNSIGQRVLRTKTTDPKKVTTMITYDPYDREVSKEILDPNQMIFSCQEMTYDPVGNLLERRDLIFIDGIYQKTQAIRYQYTPTDEIQSCTRAYGTPWARTTTYAYTPSGKIAVTRKPDGINLCYSYDPFGYLAELTSSNGSTRLTYSYNRLGHLVQARDLTTGVTIQLSMTPTTTEQLKKERPMKSTI